MKKAHLNAFPSVPLKKTHWTDVVMKFSSELLILGLVALVGFLNIIHLDFGAGKNFSDNSQAFKLLANHAALNPKYYAEQTSVSTVVVDGGGLITQAYADDFEGLTAEAEAAAPDNDASSSIVSDDAITASDPDDIQSLIAKQIKVYVTQPGDTLASIAAANGVTEQTLEWNNNLPNATIQPGWDLIIPPVDGIVVTADSNTTLPDIANKYKVDINTIIAYNGLADAEDISAGQIIIVPGAVEPVTPKPATTTKKPGVISVPKFVDEMGSHIFPWGYCTWYVASKIHVPWGGDAKYWLANARALGVPTGSAARSGSIVVTNESARYGHVAIVQSVSGSGITVSEMNYSAFGKVDTRFIPFSSGVIRGYIYMN